MSFEFVLFVNYKCYICEYLFFKHFVKVLSKVALRNLNIDWQEVEIIVAGIDIISSEYKHFSID